MVNEKFDRTLEELQKHACNWWPREVRDEANKMSVMGLLLDTQDKFVSILNLVNPSEPDSLMKLIEASSFGFNVFLKHLIVLTDFGAEQLQRVNKNFSTIFENGILEYQLPNGEPTKYKFKRLPCKGVLNNKKMKTDTKENLLSGKEDRALCEDVIMLLMFGAACTTSSTAAILFKCTPYTYLGNKSKIEKFVKSNYIRVSKIIAGKTANDMGNGAQLYALNFLKSKLGKEYNIRFNGTIPEVTENDGVTLATFDIVVDRKSDQSHHKPYVGIEVSFQETTNSVIERKATLARNRFEKVCSHRSYMAYILDGVGNFTRTSAANLICENSHCTVAFTQEEFEVLIRFIKERLG